MKLKGYPGRVFIVGILSIMIFLAVLGILNIISSYIEDPSFHRVISFLNQNIVLLVLISLLTLIGDVFLEFPMPTKVIYPIFHASGGALWVVFFFNVFKLVDELALSSVYDSMSKFYFTALIVIPLVILIIGFSKIIIVHFSKSNRVHSEKPAKKSSRKKRKS